MTFNSAPGLTGNRDMKTFHYIVRGRVQGVAFRYYTKKAADKLAVKGTVKNVYTGDVEVYARGDGDSIKKFEEFLNRGPVAARVDTVTKEETNTDDTFHNFDIIF
ncbi:MAG: acylphosphatase [bacterium]|nr:acylphosphatase [bacterium]